MNNCKKWGYVLVGSGLFLFGMVDWWLPAVLCGSGVLAIIFDDEFYF